MLIYMVLQYLYEKHESETIFTYNFVMNIQDVIDKEFGFIERAYSIGVNDYFSIYRPIYHMKRLTMDLENISLKLIII